MSDNNNSGNVYLCTNFRNGGRRAGLGMYEDDYSEDSGYMRFGERSANEYFKPVRFPNDGVKPEELNGEVVIIKAGKKD